MKPRARRVTLAAAVLGAGVVAVLPQSEEAGIYGGDPADSHGSPNPSTTNCRAALHPGLSILLGIPELIEGVLGNLSGAEERT